MRRARLICDGMPYELVRSTSISSLTTPRWLVFARGRCVEQEACKNKGPFSALSPLQLSRRSLKGHRVAFSSKAGCSAMFVGQSRRISARLKCPGPRGSESGNPFELLDLEC